MQLPQLDPYIPLRVLSSEVYHVMISFYKSFTAVGVNEKHILAFPFYGPFARSLYSFRVWKQTLRRRSPGRLMVAVDGYCRRLILRVDG